MYMVSGRDISFGNTRFITIEEVREEYNKLYDKSNLNRKLMLKAWLYHSESRVKNNHSPFTLQNYSHAMRDIDLLDQVKIDILDCSDIGGKEEIIAYLTKRIYG
ncbi:MAG: hypothetical protein M0P99_00930 [Candidatus Cloacimonetes bacterium]|nr:hypothetical protein [Candidatus Cloacimonadota bacterium]